MITVTVDPILISFGHYAIRWYSLIVMLAVGAGLWFTIREAKRKGFSKEAIYDLATWVFIGGLIGARLFHVIDHWDIFSRDPRRIIAIWEGGLAVWGAVAGGMLPLTFFAWLRRLNFSRLLDLFAPGLVLGQAIGRIACVITGDSVGRPTEGPFGLAYTSSNAMVPQLGVYYTPTPIFEFLLNASIFALLLKLRKTQLPDGALFLIYLSLHSIGRFSIAFVSSYREFIFGLNQAQVVSLIGLLIAVPLLARMLLYPRLQRA
jgi:phosphatidylglycerol---prolipoprotein diacylglyceryl transferase